MVLFISYFSQLFSMSLYHAGVKLQLLMSAHHRSLVEGQQTAGERSLTRFLPLQTERLEYVSRGQWIAVSQGGHSRETAADVPC